MPNKEYSLELIMKSHVLSYEVFFSWVFKYNLARRSCEVKGYISSVKLNFLINLDLLLQK